MGPLVAVLALGVVVLVVAVVLWRREDRGAQINGGVPIHGGCLLVFALFLLFWGMVLLGASQ